MPSSAISTFTDTDAYHAAIQNAEARLLNLHEAAGQLARTAPDIRAEDRLRSTIG
jgi:hypothetical protein